MSAKLPQVRLRHILEEIDGLLTATQGLSMADVLDDFRNRRMVERSIQIISEAAKELPAEIRAREPDLQWPDIIGIGNLLRHEYYRINPKVLEKILHQDLQALRPAIVRLLAAFPG